MKEEKGKKVSVRSMKKCCEDIFYIFECPADTVNDKVSSLVDHLAPWEDLVKPDDSRFEQFFKAIRVSFGVGYALGQMLDVLDVDATPIQDYLKERKVLFYVPHKKAA